MIIAALAGPGTGFDLRDYILFWPGVVVALVVAVASSGRLARAAARPWPVIFGLVFSVGVIVAATLTPGRDALLFGVLGSGRCDLSDVALPSLSALRSVNDTSLNVLLFVPLGVAVAFAGWSRPTAALIVVAFAFPFAIEAVQLVVTRLGRSCQSADVVDNLSGLVLGLAVAGLLAAGARIVGGAVAVGPEGRGDPPG